MSTKRNGSESGYDGENRRGRPRRAGAAVAAALATLVAAAVFAFAAPAARADAAATAGPLTWNVRVGAETPDMAVSAMTFLPKEVWINVGDTVHWTSNSAEPHTVTFLAPGGTLGEFNPFDPSQTTPQGSSVYDGTAYTNSGIMATQPFFIFTKPAAAYDLTFTAAGDFTYYCLVHGAMMKGTVHVRPAGTSYPHTQLDYDRMGTQQGQDALLAGNNAWRQARQTQATTGSSVLVGIDGDGFGVMRFVRDHVVVHVGDTVSFFMAGPGAPHTVTFGQEPPGLAVLVPSGDPTHYAGGDLNSGLLRGAPFNVTFLTVGTFQYICAIHDDMGMVGDVVVEP